MTKVLANMTMSLDGYVSHPTDGVNILFGWYGRGDVVTETSQPDRWELRTDAAEAEMLAQAKTQIGAIVSGRRNFDDAGGWNGRHPLGMPVVVLTHNPPADWPADTDIVFVTEGGIAAAIAKAKEIAGPDRDVVIATADLTQQALNAGLLDELTVDLVAAMLGEGVRFFDNLENTPYELRQIGVRPGNGVVHLAYKVIKP